MMNEIENVNNELVEIFNNQVVVSSKQVAESFGKRHDKLLFEIKRMYNKYIVEIGMSKMVDTPLFYEHEYVHPQNNQKYKEYLMNRDGFSLLVMGFTGEKALEWKIKYIKAFDAMEKQLKMNSMLPDFTNPVEAAKAWIKQYEEKEQLQKQLEEAKPKADFADAITACKTSIPVGLFAKTIAKQLNIGRNRLFEKLREWNLLMTLPSEYNKPTQKAIDLGIFEMEEKQRGVDTFKVKVKVTPKGQIYIYKRLTGYVNKVQQAALELSQPERKPMKMVMPTEFQIFKKAMECEKSL